MISPDGEYVAAKPKDGGIRLYRMRDGRSAALAVVASEEKALSFSADGKSLYVAMVQESPARARVFRIDIATGRRESRAEIAPADPSGVPEIDNIFITPDGEKLAFGFHRVLNDLFVAETH